MYDVDGYLKILSKIRKSMKPTRKKELWLIDRIRRISMMRDMFILEVAANEMCKASGCNCPIPGERECIDNCNECVRQYLYDKVEEAYGEAREEHRRKVV